MRFVAPAERAPIPEALLTPQHSLLETVLTSQRVIERACLQQKASWESSDSSDSGSQFCREFRVEYIVYLWNLAEEMQFPRALRYLVRVLANVDGAMPFMLGFQGVVRAGKGLSVSSPTFFSDFNVGSVLAMFSSLYVMSTAMEVLSPETLAALWLLSFLLDLDLFFSEEETAAMAAHLKMIERVLRV